MKQQEKTLHNFQIIGITTRTSNADEMKGAGKISDLWKRFYAEGIADQIPGKSDPAIFAVYHSYENDKYDFEVYDQRSADPRSAEVEIYTGLKPS